MRNIALAVIFTTVLFSSPAPADIESWAIVNEDGSLLVRGRTIRLFGIYIPPTERTCRAFIRPVRCASRAVLALDFKVQGFVRCQEIAKLRDGSISAVCRVGQTSHVDGDDLAAHLLLHGWAVALPAAPFEYIVLERIARARQRGIWGFPVDVIQ